MHNFIWHSHAKIFDVTFREESDSANGHPSIFASAVCEHEDRARRRGRPDHLGRSNINLVKGPRKGVSELGRDRAVTAFLSEP